MPVTRALTFPARPALRVLFGSLLLLALLLAAAPPAQAQASPTASAPEAASVHAADPALVRQAERQTVQGDERILADITARLARNAAFADVTVRVQAGVATLGGSVADADSRALAAKVAGAINGVLTVNNDITIHTTLNARVSDTMALTRERLLRLASMVPLALVALLTVVLANWLGRWIASHLHLLRLDSRNPYLGTLIRRVVRTVFVIGGLLLALDLLEATALVTAVLGSAGVMGIVLGFAFRDMVENYLSGILLSLRRPFEPGDLVRVDAHEGRVVALSPRNTVLMTPDGNELRVPNATVFKAVLLNFTQNPRRRFQFALSVGLNKDLRQAQDVGVATLAAMQGVLDNPGPSAAIDAVGGSAVTVNFFAWVDQRSTDFSKARSEGIRLVKAALDGAQLGVPGTVYAVQLTPADAALPPAAPAPQGDGTPAASAPVDPHALARTQADVSPSAELDAQFARERALKADEDMLQPQPAKPH